MKNGSGKFQFLPGVLSELFSGKCQVGIFANFCRFTHWTWEPVRLKSHKNCALDLGTGNLIGVNSSCYSAAIYTSLLLSQCRNLYLSTTLLQCRNLYLSTTLLQCCNLYLFTILPQCRNLYLSIIVTVPQFIPLYYTVTVPQFILKILYYYSFIAYTRAHAYVHYI